MIAWSLKPGVRCPPAAFCTPELRDFQAALEMSAQVARVRALVITDWFRDADSNRVAGGDPRSFHLRGLAVDLRLGPDADKIAAVWQMLGLDAVREPDHWHLEWDGDGVQSGILA